MTGRKDYRTTGPEPGRILAFWLDEVGPERWYRAEPALDARMREGFSALHAQALAGRLDHWLSDPQGALALVILLDQFPRNMFRGSAAAFASDARGRALAKQAIALGHDRRIPEPARQFFYLPLMHSEGLADQERCVRLIRLRMEQMGGDNLDHARRHRDVIRRFGRFPSRNAVLGRRDTEAERAYREQGGYMA